MTDLPFETGSFDHVLASNVIYHGDESVVRRTLSEIARVLRSGGTFMATMISARRLPVEQVKARGREISRNTWIFEGAGDKIHPHYFCTATDLLSLMWLRGLHAVRPTARKARLLALAPSGRTSGMSAELIDGARVILDDRVETASVRIEVGRITGIDVARDGATVVPAQGRSSPRHSSTSMATPSSVRSCRARCHDPAGIRPVGD